MGGDIVLRKVESHELLTSTKGLLNKNKNNNDKWLKSANDPISQESEIC